MSIQPNAFHSFLYLRPSLKSETIFNADWVHIVYYQCRLFICFSQHSFCQACRHYVHLKGCGFYPQSCVCHIQGLHLTPDRCLLLTCQSNPHIILLILSVPTVDWLVEWTSNVAKVRILSIAFHKQFPLLQKGHIFLSISGGLQGYIRTLKGAELCPFNSPTPRYMLSLTHSHLILSQTIVYISSKTH